MADFNPLPPPREERTYCGILCSIPIFQHACTAEVKPCFVPAHDFDSDVLPRGFSDGFRGVFSRHVYAHALRLT